MENSEGYVKHPCQGCEIGYQGCELYCRLIEKWNMRHLGDVSG